MLVQCGWGDICRDTKCPHRDVHEGDIKKCRDHVSKCGGACFLIQPATIIGDGSREHPFHTVGSEEGW